MISHLHCDLFTVAALMFFLLTSVACIHTHRNAEHKQQHLVTKSTVLATAASKKMFFSLALQIVPQQTNFQYH